MKEEKVQKETLTNMVKLFSTRVPGLFIGERIVLSTNGVGKIGYPHAKV